MSGPMSDCYVLSRERSAAAALAFLDAFVPQRSNCWDEDDPAEVLGVAPGPTFPELLRQLEVDRSLAYTLYFRNAADAAPYFAILAWCGDGALILGLCGGEDAPAAEALLVELEAFSGTQGYWSLEEPPVDSTPAFLARCRRRRPC